MLQTVLFDMGNVLVHFSHDQMCQQIGHVVGADGAVVRQRLLDSGLFWKFERGEWAPADLIEQVERLFSCRVDAEALRIAVSDIFTLNEPLLSVIDSLKQQGYRLVLLSNTSVWHYEWIRDRFAVLQQMDALVMSFEVRAMKPEPAIYEAAIAAAGCPADQIAYTDDIPRYIEAAQQMGIRAAVFRDVPGFVAFLDRLGVTTLPR
jgi:glucose-1-phosphatase